MLLADEDLILKDVCKSFLYQIKSEVSRTRDVLQWKLIRE
jgi:hypothetical protein